MGLRTKYVGRLAIGASAFFIFAGAAPAADIPRPVHKARPLPPVYDWSGLYAGINGGAGLDTSNFVTAGDIKVRARGALIGGTAGYNLRRGRWVLGIEGDLVWTNASGDTPCGAFFCEAKNDWLGTLRGRAGYAVGHWLPYLTAGLAAGHVETTSTDPAQRAAAKPRSAGPQGSASSTPSRGTGRRSSNISMCASAASTRARPAPRACSRRISRSSRA